MIHNMSNIAPIGSLFYNDTTMTTSKEGRALTLDTTTSGGVKLATTGETVIGIVPDSNLYSNGDPIGVIGIEGQIVDAYAGSAGFAIGDPVKATTSGGVVTAGATDNFFGLALDTATTGTFGRIVIRAGGSIAAAVSFTRAATTIYPTVDADTIATGPRASDAAVIEIAAANLVTNGTGTNVDLAITCKGSGVVKLTNGSITALPLLPYIVATQGTTGTVATAGQIAVASLTSAAVIIATMAESITTTALAYVVATTGHFTCYDNTNSAISGKKVNYIVLSL